MYPIPSLPASSAIRRLMLATALMAGAGTPVAAQVRADAPARWSVVTPAGALAWFDLMADLRLPGAGAFPLVEWRDRAMAPADRALAEALARTRDSEILHFAPLYYPSADRAALAAALRGAASTPALAPALAPAVAPAPRAALLVGALSRSLTGELRSARLPELAAALERRSPVVPPAPARILRLQRELDSLYLPALAPWLALERLDAGRLIVAPGIGTEGRIFSGTQDRADNLVAVGDFAADADPSAPLLAFVRELCFPAVTRASQGVAGFDASNVDGARRASLAAVRCGAALLDTRLPERSDAYRAFWSRRAAADFDRAFPPDQAIAGAVDRAIARVRAVR